VRVGDIEDNIMETRLNHQLRDGEVQNDQRKDGEIELKKTSTK